MSVFDALYASLEKHGYFIGRIDKTVIDEERLVDSLLQNYILNRRERYLRDLDANQTRRLVERKLSGDPDGCSIILSILDKVFRSEADGNRESLSGKPVIVSFLLDIIDDIRVGGSESPLSISEWDIYKIIVDRLMLRDFRRSPSVSPDQRRQALRRLAISLSHRGISAAYEDDIMSVIDDVFRMELRRFQGEDRRARRNEMFQDIRSSATLTRKERSTSRGDAWQFSHNSLREYLVAESIVDAILQDGIIRNPPAISDAMRTFAISIPQETQERIVDRLQAHWPQRDPSSMQTFLSLLWEALRRHPNGLSFALSSIARTSGPSAVDLNGMSFDRVTLSIEDFPTENATLMLNGSTVNQSKIDSLKLSGSVFDNSVLDSVVFENCDLSGTSFRHSLLFECTFRSVQFVDADFRDLESGTNFLVLHEGGGSQALSDNAAIGYLRFHGASTDAIPEFYVAQHHPKFPIVMKICQNISDQRNSQLRGLTQRGSAHSDPDFARRFVDFLGARGLISFKPRQLVSVTPEGRRAIPRLIEHQELFDGLIDFLELRKIVETTV